MKGTLTCLPILNTLNFKKKSKDVFVEGTIQDEIRYVFTD